MAVSTITISMVRIVTIAIGRVVSIAITKVSIAISVVGISRGFSYCSGLSLPLSKVAVSTIAITMVWVVTIAIGRVVAIAITKVPIAISIVGISIGLCHSCGLSFTDNYRCKTGNKDGNGYHCCCLSCKLEDDSH